MNFTASESYFSGNPRHGQEISRILTAAVINEPFRKLLLANPDKALAAGYHGEPFHLGQDERTRLIAIRASSLAEFAAQIPQY